jgi:sirohydrochlorin ferrochelatase
MSDEQVNAISQVEAPQEVDRIRDIIFGHQMRDYDQRFQIVRRDLERLQQELDRLAERLAEQDSSQAKRLQELRQEMRRADDDLRDELRQAAQTLTDDKVDRVALGELFIELGTHLKSGGFLVDLLKDLAEKKQG